MTKIEVTTDVGSYRYIVMTYHDIFDKNKTRQEYSFQTEEKAMIFAEYKANQQYHVEVFNTLAFSVVND